MNEIASWNTLQNSEPNLVLRNLPGSPKIPSAVGNSQRILILSSRKKGLAGRQLERRCDAVHESLCWSDLTRSGSFSVILFRAVS